MSKVKSLKVLLKFFIISTYNYWKSYINMRIIIILLTIFIFPMMQDMQGHLPEQKEPQSILNHERQGVQPKKAVPSLTQMKIPTG